MPNEKHYKCPVCGFKGLDEPSRDKDGNASFEICPSCGTEFGYDDATKSAAQLRREWLGRGAAWWSKTVKPPKNWNPVMQLRGAKLLDEVMAVSGKS